MARGKPRMIIIDDDRLMLESMADILGKKGYSVLTFREARAALDDIGGGAADIIVVDLKMPGMNGLELLRAAKDLDRDLPVIVMTAYSTVGSAVEAMKHGAYDYVQKPFDVEELDIVARRALEERRLLLQQDYIARRQSAEVANRELIGKSEKMARVHHMIQKVAPSDSIVLITGESGTGKELVARHIHQSSPRRNRLLVAVNAAALPESLLESELFGHTRGAFTGADRDRKGLFQTADGATLFLDEIALMPPTMQAKLLRAIEEHEIRPVGSSQSIHVDARLIVSTNVNLADAVRQGNFREDLFYRLNVFPIELPLLRERREDIPSLADHFLRRYASKTRKPIEALSAEALEVLSDYDWPGNVRELEHVVERAVLIEDGSEITPASLFLTGAVRHLESKGVIEELLDMPFHQARAAFEKQYLISKVHHAKRHSSMTALATELGIHRTTLYDLIERHGIDLQAP